jgi:hypothetical protein
MEILIGKEYKITADPLNIILNKRYVQKDKDQNIVDENAFKVIGYYPDLESACVGLLRKSIHDSDAGHLNELIGFIRQMERDITKAVKSEVIK